MNRECRSAIITAHSQTLQSPRYGEIEEHNILCLPERVVQVDAAFREMLEASSGIYMTNSESPDPVTITIEKAFGYQGDAMHLPVSDVVAALPFYEKVLGFRVVSRSEHPLRSAVLERDKIRIGFAENGGDPTQDGCAFHVTGLQSLFEEFQSNGLNKERQEFDVERHGGAAFNCFYVVAPDGLCYWFGERVL